MKQLLQILSITAFIASALHGNAQKTFVSGTVVDSSRQAGLAYATVSLVYANDSTLVACAHADSVGRFSMRPIDKGSYLLSASYVGFVMVWQPVVVNGLTATAPVITIDKDGTVKVNGQAIKHVLVNGKEFFTSDVNADEKI